jgi:hypothetical protein
VRLHRLSSHRDGLDNVRKLLAKRVRKKKGRQASAEDDVEAQIQHHHQYQRSNMPGAEMSQERGATHEHAVRHVLQPGLLQVVTWQMPVMFLTSATICMIVGLFLHIWSATPHVGRMGTWDDDSKVRTRKIYRLF